MAQHVGGLNPRVSVRVHEKEVEAAHANEMSSCRFGSGTVCEGYGEKSARPGY